MPTMLKLLSMSLLFSAFSQAYAFQMPDFGKGLDSVVAPEISAPVFPEQEFVYEGLPQFDHSVARQQMKAMLAYLSQKYKIGEYGVYYKDSDWHFKIFYTGSAPVKPATYSSRLAWIDYNIALEAVSSWLKNAPKPDGFRALETRVYYKDSKWRFQVAYLGSAIAKNNVMSSKLGYLSYEDAVQAMKMAAKRLSDTGAKICESAVVYRKSEWVFDIAYVGGR